MGEEALIANLVAYNNPNKYDLLSDSYFGSGGFETGDYLIPHTRELAERYSRRQTMAYYCNYVKPVVNAHVNPIFKTSPTREIKSGKLYADFLENVDGKKTTMNSFMKEISKQAKLNGVMFVVVDAPNIEGQTLSLAKVKENRLYPYLYSVHPKNVKDYALDNYGNLIYIEYTLKVVELVGTEKKSYSQTWKWTNTNWSKTDVNGNEIRGINSIGTIPIVPVFGALCEEGQLIPQSEIYSIAKTNYSLYNACSELRERNRNQAFSILTFPVADDNMEVINNINVGTSDMLVYADGSQKPEFITPDAEPSDMLKSEITMMIQEIYRMASLQLVTGIQTQASGISKEWDNLQLFQTIAEFSDKIQESERKIAHIFGEYVGENISVVISYNKQFGIADPTETLNMATQALALNICPEYNYEIRKKLITDTLKDVDDVVVNRVISNLETDPNSRNPINMNPTVMSYSAK